MKGETCTASIGMFTTPATMETYLNAPDVDWFLKAANYYYLAISRMSSSLSESYMPSSSAVLEHPVDVINNWLRQQMHNSPPSATDNSVWKRAEALIMTATVLTMYRLISEPGERWQSYVLLSTRFHCTGFQYLTVPSTQLSNRHQATIRFVTPTIRPFPR